MHYLKAMTIEAIIQNNAHQNRASVRTNGIEKEILIPAKIEGRGSAVNGGELLFLSLATCFCNDLYREAARRAIEIESVEVKVTGEFGKEGEPAANIRYHVDIKSSAPLGQNKGTHFTRRLSG